MARSKKQEAAFFGVSVLTPDPDLGESDKRIVVCAWGAWRLKPDDGQRNGGPRWIEFQLLSDIR